MSSIADDPQVIAAVGRKLGIKGKPDPDQAATITDGILDAMGPVETHLNRRLTPERKTTITRAAGLRVTDQDSAGIDEDDVVTIVSRTARADGSFEVVYDVGIVLDARHPITRFLIASAAEAITHDPANKMGKRVVASLTAEGQSVKYEPRADKTGAAGAALTLNGLNAYRRTVVFRRPAPIRAPWPNDGTPVGWDPR